MSVEFGKASSISAECDATRPGRADQDALERRADRLRTGIRLVESRVRGSQRSTLHDLRQQGLHCREAEHGETPEQPQQRQADTLSTPALASPAASTVLRVGG